MLYEKFTETVIFLFPCIMQTLRSRVKTADQGTFKGSSKIQQTYFQYYYFASAAVAVDSSHMTASSSASWSRFSPLSKFVNGYTCRQCGSWSIAGHNHGKVIGRDPICAS